LAFFFFGLAGFADSAGSHFHSSPGTGNYIIPLSNRSLTLSTRVVSIRLPFFAFIDLPDLFSSWLSENSLSGLRCLDFKWFASPRKTNDVSLAGGFLPPYSF